MTLSNLVCYGFHLGAGMLMPDFAFEFLESPGARSKEKPRARGITSIYDYGKPIGYQRDVLRSAGHWIDFAKIVSASPRVLPKDVLREKLAVYEDADVVPYMGGQIYEYTVATLGEDGVTRLFDTAIELGFKAVEISDTVTSIDASERTSHIGLCRDRGLTVIAEIGAVDDLRDASFLWREIDRCFDDGADHVIVEGMELIGPSGPRSELIAAMAEHASLDRIWFETPWPGYEGVTASRIVELKKTLIAEVGADVNLANIPPEEVVELEGMRHAIENPAIWPKR
jgi:phosphosulfolactate synthase